MFFTRENSYSEGLAVCGACREEEEEEEEFLDEGTCVLAAAAAGCWSHAACCAAESVTLHRARGCRRVELACTQGLLVGGSGLGRTPSAARAWPATCVCRAPRMWPPACPAVGATSLIQACSMAPSSLQASPRMHVQRGLRILSQQASKKYMLRDPYGMARAPVLSPSASHTA